MTSAQLKVIQDISQPMSATQYKDLPPLYAAALDYADAATLNIKVPKEIFDRLKALVNDQQMVEITLTVGTFNMIARFVIPLDADDAADQTIPVPS